MTSILCSFILGIIVARIYYRLKTNNIHNNLNDIKKRATEFEVLTRNSDIATIYFDEDDNGDETIKPEIVGDDNTKQAIAKVLETEIPNIYSALIARDTYVKEQVKKLRESGVAFETFSHNIEIIGTTDGAKALIILRIAPVNYGARGTNNLDFPMWKADSKGNLIWGNRAFLKAVEADSIEDAVKENAKLDSKIPSDCQKAMQGEAIIDTRAINIGGKRRMMRIHISQAFDGIIGVAVDVENEYSRNEILVREAKANNETLNQLNDAVAVFDGNRELKTYNSAFARLWGFEESWLDEKPLHEEFLDRLRERSRLPHQRNYFEWRKGEIAYYHSRTQIPDETWSLPDGRILRVMRQRQPTGGLLILFEDISDKTMLQAQFKTQLEVQRATLDKLSEGIAVFASDGRLTLANKSFHKMWNMSESALDDLNDFAALANNLKTLYGDETFWDDLWARVCDPSPEGRKETSGRIHRNDDTYLSWVTRPLPDGATLVAFADVSAHHRIEALLREKALALTEADRLKTSFLEKVSYQLRTPLNTILGYSDLLTAGFSGDLNEMQSEQLKSIKQAGEQLEHMVGNLLDLAIIDAGQAPLDLSNVDIADAIATSVETAHTKLLDTRVNIKSECPENIGTIYADDKRVRQILANLLSNAMRSASAGDDVTIGAKRIGESMRLFIEAPNHGSVSFIGNVEFDAFTEGSKRGGLGLVLVRKFVELHGGWVAMDFSKLDKLKITCHLPVQAVPNEAKDDLEQELNYG